MPVPAASESDKWHELAAVFESANSAYHICDKDGTRVPLNQARPVGTGGASVVYLATFKGGLRRAVKLLSPKSDLLVNQSPSAFLNSFRNEQEILASLNHENVAVLVDFGASDTEAVPFVATQYVDGVTLDDFIAEPNVPWSDIWRVLDQILRGIAYLHKNRILHTDIKPDNIRIRQERSDQDFNAVILDLGGARLIPTELDRSKRDELTYFFSTPGYMLPELEPWAANKTNNKCPWRILVDAFPAQDLYSFGKILQKVVEAKGNAIPPQLANGLARIAERLLAKQYPSAVAVAAALDRLRGNVWNAVEIPELLTGSAAATAIRTYRGLIGTDGRLQCFIDHPLMQRLRRVPQLDLLDHVLPGATHSRFLLSLHNLELARTAISRITSVPDIGIDLSRTMIDAFLFRALMANIGHYQLMHIFEDLIEDRRRPGPIASVGLKSGEEIFRDLLLSEGDEGTSWSRVRDYRGATFGELARHELGSEWITSALRVDRMTQVEALLSGLLNSPIDIQKMGYLMDDSLMTGVSFGRAVDPEEIFSALILPRPEDLPANGGAVVTLRESAISYIEDEILARYWQIQKSYWQRTNRSLQAMVKYLVTRLVAAGLFDFEEYLSQTMFLDRDSAIRWLSAKFEEGRGSDSIPSDSTNPMIPYLECKRVIYSRVLTLSPRSLSEARKGDENIYRELRGKTALELDGVAEDVRDLLRGELGLKSNPGEVLIDLPRRQREELGGHVVIYSDDQVERLGSINAVSPIVGKLEDNFDQYAKRVRVFVHPRLLEESGMRKRRLRDSILAYLRQNYGSAR